MSRVTSAGAVWACCSAVGLFVLTSLAIASERRQMDAHEHGVTILNVAAEDGVVLLELEGPAMNFVGFEYPPRTTEQKQAVQDTVAKLQAGASLFSLSPAADCRLAGADSRYIGAADLEDESHEDEGHDDHHDEAGHDDHDEDESAHSEFAAEYRFDCANPDKLAALTVGLFQQFPLTSEVEASYAGADFQTFRELTPDSPTLSLQP